MSDDKEKDKELKSQIASAAERLVQTLGASSQQDPLWIQERVSAAVTDAVNSKLQPLVEDMVHSAQRKDNPLTGAPGTSGGRCAFPHMGVTSTWCSPLNSI